MSSASRAIWSVVWCRLVGYRDENDVALDRLGGGLRAGEGGHQIGGSPSGCGGGGVGRSPQAIRPSPIATAMQAGIPEVKTDARNQHRGKAAQA